MKSCRPGWIIEVVTPYFRRTASIVVSRCKLSSTTFALNSAVYCCRFLVVISFWYLSREHLLPYPLVHYIRYRTNYGGPICLDKQRAKIRYNSNVRENGLSFAIIY